MAADTDDEHPALPPGLAAAWGVRPSSRRGPKPALTIEKIVEAAIGLADAEGLAAVSMSRLAESLGFTTMSLYRYVSSKDELLTLMVDVGYGQPSPEVGRSADWRAELSDWARQALDGYRSHPWICEVPINGPPATPNQLIWLDRILQSLIDSRLDYQEQLGCALLLSGYVRDWATLTRGLAQGEEQRVARGEPQTQFSEVFGPFITPDRYPALAPVIAAGEFDDDSDEPEEFDDQFGFGLARVLDGIGVLIDQRQAPSRPAKASSRAATRSTRGATRAAARGPRKRAAKK
jgi:AcrR family transcriptional regulator